jgi:hypothetical protein
MASSKIAGFLQEPLAITFQRRGDEIFDLIFSTA